MYEANRIERLRLIQMFGNTVLSTIYTAMRADCHVPTLTPLQIQRDSSSSALANNHKNKVGCFEYLPARYRQNLGSLAPSNVDAAPYAQRVFV